MRATTFRGFASEIRAGNLDTIDLEVREREVVQALKKSSWLELIFFMILVIVFAFFAVSVAQSISSGNSLQSIPRNAMLAAALSFSSVVSFERNGRGRARREFIARYEQNKKTA